MRRPRPCFASRTREAGGHRPSPLRGRADSSAATAQANGGEIRRDQRLPKLAAHKAEPDGTCRCATERSSSPKSRDGAPRGDAGFLVFSSLHIVIGEQVPKTLAIRQPEPVSQWIAYPLFASYVLFYPLNWLLNAASRGVLAMIGVQEASPHEILTGVEIEGLVGQSAEHGGIESGEAEYIQNVFRFGDLAVSDVMVHRTAMTTLNADLPSEELVREVLSTEYTRIPLWREKPENIVGVLHAKDLLRAIRAADGDTSKIDVASIALPPWFVPEMRPLSDQLKAFRRRKTHFALVVDEYGEVEGMVTLEDILEEIVGDISDEHDDVVAGVRAQADGSVVVDGSVPIRDLNRVMDWHLPDDEAVTVAGLVIHEARSIPERGQSFTFYNFRFRVLRRERNRITALRIGPVPAESEQATEKKRRAGASF